MTIYDLLKNSSPSMAKHFKESDEGYKKNTEDISRLETRVSTLENGGGSGGSSTVYEPFTTMLTVQGDFELKHKQINNTTYDAYYMYKNMGSSSNESFIYTPLFSPHCSKYLEVDGTKVYIAVPIMDFEDEVYLNPDKLGIAITRKYDEMGKLSDIDFLVTKKLYDSLTSGSTTMYEVCL